MRPDVCPPPAGITPDIFSLSGVLPLLWPWLVGITLQLATLLRIFSLQASRDRMSRMRILLRGTSIAH